MKHNPLIDEKALAALHADVWDWALFQCGYDRERAADTLQASYLKVVSGDARFGGHSALRTCLFGVVRLTGFEQRRRDARNARDHAARESGQGADLIHEALLPTTDSFDEGTIDADRTSRAAGVNAALAELSFSQREVTYLVFYRDLTLAEAGRVLGMRLGTVRTHYERAKRRLRERLGSTHAPLHPQHAGSGGSV